MASVDDTGTKGRKNGFGVLVRELRIAAGLTQDELAERSGLSVRTVRNLELGVSRRPHSSTTQLIAAGLELEAAAAAELYRSAHKLQRDVPCPYTGNAS